MAFSAYQTGNAATIAFGTTTSYGSDLSNTVEVTSISIDGISLPSVDVSHLGSSGYRDYIPGDLKEGGTVTCEFLADTDVIPEPVATAETITITSVITDGTSGTAPTIAFSGHIADMSLNFANDEVVGGTYSLKVCGDITFTDSST